MTDKSIVRMVVMTLLVGNILIGLLIGWTFHSAYYVNAPQEPTKVEKPITPDFDNFVKSTTVDGIEEPVELVEQANSFVER